MPGIPRKTQLFGGLLHSDRNLSHYGLTSRSRSAERQASGAARDLTVDRVGNVSIFGCDDYVIRQFDSAGGS